MQQANPPFRADHVGSLLRPENLKVAREKHQRGEISIEELTEVENNAIDHVVRQQRAVGLNSVTDGEFRRYAWQTDFLANLDGTEWSVGALPLPGSPNSTFRIARIVGKIGFSGHPMIDHFKYLKSHLPDGTAKMTIPSPTMMISVMRDWRGVVAPGTYESIDEIVQDLGPAYRKAIRAFYDAGCRYLQIDDCNLAFICDPARQQALRDRGEHPEALIKTFIKLLANVLSEKPADMTITAHLCRGNLRSTWMTEGGYEPVADRLLNDINVDGFFLEYDSERAGGFEPLRFLPKGKKNRVVLGLITTKSGAIEDKDAIKRRIDEASRFLDLDRLCLSPQCGFASSEEGNMLSEDEQWRKLALVREIADEVWG